MRNNEPVFGIRIDGPKDGLAIEDFIALLKSTARLLRAVERDTSPDGKSHIKWYISELRLGDDATEEGSA